MTVEAFVGVEAAETKLEMLGAVRSIVIVVDAVAADAGPVLPEDAAINHDHYLYGTPKKYLKKRGKWVLAEPEAGR